MHRRTIAIVDLANGRVTNRARNTLTLDVPADFDRSACVASRGHYLSTEGTSLLNPAHPRPLSWRARGEECLVASARDSADTVAYRLCAVDPAKG
jgi:hypothetical protein